jgi:inner membrane protein
MDPITHGLFGGLAAQAVTRHRRIRPTLITGFFAALLADLDTLISSSTDPLFSVEIHRQFTHSLLFIPVGALVATLIMFWFQRQYLSMAEVYVISFIGFATSGFLDAFTSYGTQLFWPFSDVRVAWNVISVVDPVVTAGLVLAAWMLMRPERHAIAPPRTSFWAYVGLSWLAIFLLTGYVQRERARNAALDIARDRMHVVDRLVVKPTLGNRVLWRSTYISADTIYTDGIRLSWLGADVVYPGESARLIRIADFSDYEGTVMFEDIMRFKHLSDGYLVRHPESADVVGDARYAMLPTSLNPLWGIRLDRDNVEKNVEFEYFRDAGQKNRTVLWRMLRGQPLVSDTSD